MEPARDDHLLGRQGEELAARELARRGFRVLATNVRLPGAEIDLVAEDAAGLAFIEVKTRTTARFGYPYEAVRADKRQRMLDAALHYLEQNGRGDACFRIGVVSVVVPAAGGPAQLEWIDEADDA